MIAQRPTGLDQCQRIQVAMDSEGEPTAKRVKIVVEGYDEGLGWYTAGALTLPLHQLPLLEQALAQMASCEQCEARCSAKIVPFPTLRNAVCE